VRSAPSFDPGDQWANYPVSTGCSDFRAFRWLPTVRLRFGPDGIYILDEPEAALSIRRQIELLRELHAHATEKGSEIIVATHSPVLMALPGRARLSAGEDGITEVTYEETDVFRLAYATELTVSV
jgi:predicted ATPase